MLIKFVAMLALLIIGGAVVLSLSGLSENVFEADAAIILGTQVYADGTCSPRLAGRLDRAIELYEKGLVPLLIVSGGVGVSGIDETQAMRSYLLQRGIPEQAIVRDPSGLNTRATARFTANYMHEHNLHSALIVSQFFHIPRARIAFWQEGISNIGSAHSRTYRLAQDTYSVARELPAILFYLLKIR